MSVRNMPVPYACRKDSRTRTEMKVELLCHYPLGPERLLLDFSAESVLAGLRRELEVIGLSRRDHKRARSSNRLLGRKLSTVLRESAPGHRCTVATEGDANQSGGADVDETQPLGCLGVHGESLGE